MKLILIVLLFRFACAFRIESACRIPWRYVKARSFLVSWNINDEKCNLFKVILDQGRERKHLRTYENITNNYLIVNYLQPMWNYGAKTECYSSEGKLISSTRPCRTRTFKEVAVTTTLPPTATAPVGSCGYEFFTCLSNSTECIPKNQWCNKFNDCQDESDEKNCPGKCTEIDKFHDHGNYSCSRWNSPESACFFACHKGWVRIGAYYTMCHRQKWTRKVPTCVLEEPTLSVVESYTSPNTVKLSLLLSNEAADYIIKSVVKNYDYDVTNLTTFNLATSEDGLNGTLTIGGLEPDSSYSISVAAIDKYGQSGLNSDLVTANTSKTNN